MASSIAINFPKIKARISMDIVSISTEISKKQCENRHTSKNHDLYSTSSALLTILKQNLTSETKYSSAL